MGKANWRSERISVEKLLDDLRVGVKGQSSWEIARTPRNAFRGSVVIKSLLEVELLIGCGAPPTKSRQTPNASSMIYSSEPPGANVR